jgi:hypothetical protein
VPRKWGVWHERISTSSTNQQKGSMKMTQRCNRENYDTGEYHLMSNGYLCHKVRLITTTTIKHQIRKAFLGFFQPCWWVGVLKVTVYSSSVSCIFSWSRMGLQVFHAWPSFLSPRQCCDRVKLHRLGPRVCVLVCTLNFWSSIGPKLFSALFYLH